MAMTWELLLLFDNDSEQVVAPGSIFIGGGKAFFSATRDGARVTITGGKLGAGALPL